MFEIGQKVVCKDNSGCIDLKRNNIYTITGVTKCPCCGKECLELEEISLYGFFIINCSNCGKEYKDISSHYLSSRFEPLKYDLLDNMNIISELIEERADIKVPELVEN